MNMRIAIIDLRALAGKEDAVADFLQARSARSKMLEEGCLDFQIAKDSDDPANLSIIMTYATPEAQEAHRETEHFKRFVNECAPLLEDAPNGTKFFGRKLLDRIA
jgi:quinol monooxygenase YgiN